MTLKVTAQRRRTTGADAARMAVGLIWVAGALFNALFTLRQAQPYAWIAEDGTLRPYRWFFGEVVNEHVRFWTLLLIAGELAVGVLTLAKGAWAKAGLLASAAWSLWLFPMAWPYTLMMGPFALLPLWLLRFAPNASLLDLLRRGSHRPRGSVRAELTGGSPTAQVSSWPRSSPAPRDTGRAPQPGSPCWASSSSSASPPSFGASSSSSMGWGCPARC